nr:hypothetical protein [Arthrobacter globiformis]
MRPELEALEASTRAAGVDDLDVGVDEKAGYHVEIVGDDCEVLARTEVGHHGLAGGARVQEYHHVILHERGSELGNGLFAGQLELGPELPLPGRGLTGPFRQAYPALY